MFLLLKNLWLFAKKSAYFAFVENLVHKPYEFKAHHSTNAYFNYVLFHVNKSIMLLRLCIQLYIYLKTEA
jgi:hypothetical protein